MNYFNFSETSSEPFYKSNRSNIKSQKGGNSDQIQELLFNAIEENNVTALIYLLKSPVIDSINFIDKNNQNILHRMINKMANYNETNNAKLLNIMTSKALPIVLMRSDILQIINQKDSKSNTPLHLATMNELHDVADMLIKNGADKNIKNSSGLVVISVTESTVEKNAQPDHNLLEDEDSLKSRDIFIASELPKQSEQTTRKESESVFISKKALSDSKGACTIEKEFVDNIIKNLSSVKCTTSEAAGLTDALASTQHQLGGNNYSEYSNLINTDEFINDFLTKYNSGNQSQKGGKVKVKNSRKLNTNSTLKSEISINSMSSMEMPRVRQTDKSEQEKRDDNRERREKRESKNKRRTETEVTSELDIDSSSESEVESDSGSESMSESMSEVDQSSADSEMSELSRMINNQATEIHERTVKKIMELLKVSEQEARTIKAFIYNEVKTSHPELNNFDRAVEMEKRITKEYLEKLSKKDLDKLSKLITEKQQSKEQSSEKTESSEESSEEPKAKKTAKAKKTK